MIFLKKYEFYVSEYIKNYAKIAGIAIVIDDSILMVLPTKQKDKPNKWSLPKGRIEIGQDSVLTAHKELEEETGIDIDMDLIETLPTYVLPYYKKEELKNLKIYIMSLSSKVKKDINIINDIKSGIANFKPNHEIYKCKLVPLSEVKDKAEKYYKKFFNDLKTIV